MKLLLITLFIIAAFLFIGVAGYRAVFAYFGSDPWMNDGDDQSTDNPDREP